MSKYQKWDVLEVLWLDSYHTSGWTPLDQSDIEYDDSLDHRTVGYFVGETKRALSLAQSSKSNPELIAKPDTHVDAIMTIPKRGDQSDNETEGW